MRGAHPTVGAWLVAGAVALSAMLAGPVVAAVEDGAPIPPEVARRIYERIAPLREADGCALSRFDTERFRVVVGIKTSAGAEHRFELATAPDGVAADRRAGEWAIEVSPELAADCGATLAAIRRGLAATAAPAAAAAAPAPAPVGDGAAIAPEFAQQLFDRIKQLETPDGCTLSRFDTERFRIVVGLETPAGVEHRFEFATAPALGFAEQRAGGWALATTAELERDCGATLGAVKRVLEETAGPQELPWTRPWNRDFTPSNHALLAATFVILLLWTAWILVRELRARRPPPAAVLALVGIWLGALLLRLFLSPWTFLHEYYHVAETLTGYLTGELGGTYGNTGPALFRMIGAALDRRQDVEIIFLTNAVLSSLAIPAVALLDLALMASWPRALCAAVLLAVLPHHLRFSAGEDLLVLAVTFGMWALALFAHYLHTRRLADALCAALALSLAIQARPEMLLFPGVVVGMLLLVEPRHWRVLFAWRTLLALALLGLLLTPRLFELRAALQGGGGPSSQLPDLPRYLHSLVLLQERVTPPLYWALLAIGAAWTALRKPGLLAWVALIYFGYTLFSISLFDNPPFNLRAQILPTSYVVLIAAGVAPVWMALWRGRDELAVRAGAAALALLALFVVVRSRPFVTELRDQQLEWAFQERAVPRLPDNGTLLAAIDVGGRNLGAFPTFLLDRAAMRYTLVDVRRAAAGALEFPPPGENLIFYQGMYCYFAAEPGEPTPDPMTKPCLAVHERYALEPLIVETINAPGYSHMPYAGGGTGPFSVGFYRLRAKD